MNDYKAKVLKEFAAQFATSHMWEDADKNPNSVAHNLTALKAKLINPNKHD